MFAPLVSITIASIYNSGPLPQRMAKCSADTFAAVNAIATDLQAKGASLVLSDMYRSYDMQLQAHLDFTSGKKKAFSPPPGGSMHEAGRAFDLDLDHIKKLALADFWKLAAARGVSPIINKPDTKLSEAWHFDCRGSHGLVFDYYKKGNGDNFQSPYTAMAASAIVSTGQKVDALSDDPRPGYIQSGVIRLGQIIGDLDGQIGNKTRTGLSNLGIDPAQSLDALADAVGKLLQTKFPEEYFAAGAIVLTPSKPAHVIG